MNTGIKLRKDASTGSTPKRSTIATKRKRYITYPKTATNTYLRKDFEKISIRALEPS